MKQHCETGSALAHYLEAHPKVQKVYYPGLPSHPQHALAARQMKGFGGMLSFDLGSREAAAQVLKGVRLLALAESLGGVESLISHPATMTHASMTPEARARVLRGAFSEGDIVTGSGGATARIAGLLSLSGQQSARLASAPEGEVAGFAKLDGVATGEAIAAGGTAPEALIASAGSEPVSAVAISVRDRKDDVRLSSSIAKLLEERFEFPRKNIRLLRNAEALAHPA